MTQPKDSWREEFRKICKSLSLHLGYANSGEQKIERLESFIQEKLSLERAATVDYIESHPHPIQAVGHDSVLYLKLENVPEGKSFIVVSDKVLEAARHPSH